MADLTINFAIKTNAQTLDGQLRTIRSMPENFARLIVDEVAFRESSYIADVGSRRLKASLEAVVDKEIATMAMRVKGGLNLTERAKGHQGVMSVGQNSRQARALGWQSSMNAWDRKTTGIKWDARNPHYLNWKRTHGKSSNWWSMDGSLLSYLGKASTYTDAFGPVKVTIDRERAMRVGNREPNLKFTRAGVPGPITAEYKIARVRVQALGLITPSDLPSLRSNNPKDAKPSGGGPGLAARLDDNEARMKLLTPAYKTKNIRYTLEPFLSFYLTRAIPNAVWRRIEETNIVRMD